MNDADASAYPGVGDGDGLPTVYIPTPETSLNVLRQLQTLVLKHPVAANAAFRALIAEGREFAITPEGAAWRDKLLASELLHRARLILDFPGLSMLEADGSNVLPSTYIDTIFMLASSRKPDELLNSLFEWALDDDKK